MPDQVRRLIIVFAVAISALLVARSFLVPETFGKYGHYRAEAVDFEAAKPIGYAGHMICAECHDDIAALKQNSCHESISCETCHGPGAEHAEDPDVARPELPRARERCLLCHEYDPARPTGFPQVVSTHNAPDPCVGCHAPHDPALPQPATSCSACHASIARTVEVSHHSTLDCGTCHEAQEEHLTQPRAALPTKPNERSTCEACHAEGAPSPSEVPRIEPDTHWHGTLCWQCHYPHFPEAR